MTFGSLFAGIGGMDLGLERAGMECCWQVEINERNRRVLAKHWPAAKRYGDIRGVELFDEEGWRQIDETRLEPVDLVCGGFPCEDISLASATGVGIIGERSGLWSEFARVLAEVRPAFALIENVPALRSRGLALVLQNLHALGFDAEWHCIPASALGAPHQRDRVFIVAYTAGRFERPIVTGDPYDDIRPDAAAVLGEAVIGSQSDGDVSNVSEAADADSPRLEIGGGECEDAGEEQPAVERNTPGDRQGLDANVDIEPLVGLAIARGERSAWTVEPGVVRMVYGVPDRVDRVAALGRVVVPQVAEWIGRRIMEAR